jgi:DNA-directed RNA polymerase II subunit RPB2
MIGRRGHGMGLPNDSRIEYAKQLLAKNFLPHISTSDDQQSFRKKAFFVGYMVYRCLQVHCGTKE